MNLQLKLKLPLAMEIYTAAFLFLANLLTTPIHAASICKTPPIIFNFGDSNSDTGGIAAGLGFQIKFPNGRAFFGRSTGRLSDGRLIIDFLSQSVNAAFLSPYLDPLDGKFSGGANFAIAGSATLPRYVPFSLNIQVMQFTYFKARSAQLAATGVKSMIKDSMFGNALYMIDIGQNDIDDSFVKGLSYEQVVDKIPLVLAEIGIAIKELYNQGGRKFWVHNTGPLGCLPRALALTRNSSSLEKDSFGCITSYNSAAKLFNEGLNKLCTGLRSELSNATVVYVDVYSIKYDLIANSTKYGFSSPLMACCGSGGPPYNYDRAATCGVPGYQVCDQGARFVSWDGVHYTDAANSLIASRILSTEHSTPPVGFSFFCH